MQIVSTPNNGRVIEELYEECECGWRIYGDSLEWVQRMVREHPHERNLEIRDYNMGILP